MNVASLGRAIGGMSLKAKIVAGGLGLLAVGAAANGSNSPANPYQPAGQAHFAPWTQGPVASGPTALYQPVIPSLPPMWPDPPSNDGMEAIINGN